MIRKLSKKYARIFIVLTGFVLFGCAPRFTPPPSSLSGLTITPNPVSPGSHVYLDATYLPGFAGITRGTAYIFVTDGPTLSPISFKVDGTNRLRIPVPVNSFTPRSSQLIINMYVVDAVGKSNTVSATLSVQ